MAQVDFLGKGWGFPIAVKNKAFLTAEGEEAVRQSVMIILGTAKGERVMRPDFGCGIHELVFAPNSAATATLINSHVKEALLQWEPRIQVLDVAVEQDEADPGRLNISIEYRVKTTNTKYNLVYPFYLERGGT
jgi:uncharacterized protein